VKILILVLYMTDEKEWNTEYTSSSEKKKSPALYLCSDDRTSAEGQYIHKYRHIDMYMNRFCHSYLYSNFVPCATFQKIKEFGRKIIFCLKSIK